MGWKNENSSTEHISSLLQYSEWYCVFPFLSSIFFFLLFFSIFFSFFFFFSYFLFPIFFFLSTWIPCLYTDHSSSTCLWYLYSYLLTAWHMWPNCFCSWVMCSQPNCSFSFKHCLLCVYLKFLDVVITQWPLLESHNHSIIAASFLWRLFQYHWRRLIFQPAHGNAALHVIPVLFNLTRSYF